MTTRYPTDDAPKVNGKQRLLSLEALDGRTLSARRAKQLIDRLTIDLGGDLSDGERQHVRHAAVLGAVIESDSASLLRGDGGVDFPNWLSAINAQRRILSTLGLGRRAKDITPPSLADIADDIEAQR